MWTDEKIEAEATLLIQWAQKEDSLVLGRHYGARGYHNWNAMDWSKRSRIFDEAKKLALTIVGARREEMAILGSIEDNIVKKNLGLYDPEVKQYEIEIRQKETDNTQSNIMVSKICEAIEGKKNPIKKNDGFL
jgi:kynureninase